MTKKKDLTTGPVFSQMLKYALPVMLTGVLQLLYNAADTVVVGRFSVESESSLAAVGSTGALTTLILNIILGLSAGATVVVAQSYGAKEKEEVEKAVHTSIAISIIGGLIFGLIGFFGAGFFLTLMDSPPDVIGKATLYMRICFIGVPANVLYNFGSSILRATGDTKRPLIILSSTGIVNVLLNLLLVIVFRLDVAGVAIATITSQYLSAIAVVIILMRSEDWIRLSVRNIRIDKQSFLRIARMGIPSGVQSSMFSISNVIIQSAVNSLSTPMIAGNTIAANLGGFTYTVMNSFFHATLSFTGQSFGAKKYKRVNRVLWVGVIQVTVFGLAMGLSEVALGEVLAGIYNKDPEVIAAAVYRMSILLPTYFICGIMEVFAGSLRGMGYSLVPMISAIFGACVVRSWWVIVIFGATESRFWLYMSYPVSWLVTLLLHIITMAVVKKRQKRLRELPAVQS